MSVYTFRVWFSGLFHFVPNKSPHAKCQLCAVLPKTDGNRAHKAVIYKPRWVVQCGRRRLRPGKKIIPDIAGRRIAFRVTRSDDLPPESFPLELSAPGVLQMGDIAGIFTDEDESIVSADPPPGRVLAQVLFGMGYFMSIDPEVSIGRDWTLPATLTGFDFNMTLYDPVHIDIPNVSKVEIINGPLGPGITPPPIELQPDESGLIEIFISHRCEGKRALSLDDVDPRCTSNSFVLMQLDRDFEFNYKLLHPATVAGIKKALSKATGKHPDEVQLPIPESPLLEVRLAPHFCWAYLCRGHDKKSGNYRDGEARRLGFRVTRLFNRIRDHGWRILLLEILLGILGTGTGSGNDCLGGTSKPRFFSLDDFVPGPEPAVDMSLLHSKHRLEKEQSALRPLPTNEAGSQPGRFPKL